MADLDTLSPNELFIEERDLPRKLEIRDRPLKDQKGLWTNCYCRVREIIADQPHCGAEKCGRAAIQQVHTHLLCSETNDKEIFHIVSIIPKTLLDSLAVGGDITQMDIFLPGAVIEELLTASATPTELLLFIFMFRPSVSLGLIQSHPQLEQGLVGPILRKQLSPKTIETLSKFPEPWAAMFWEFRAKEKWRQAYLRALDSTFLPEKMYQYWLGCAKGGKEEDELRRRFENNPQLATFVEEASLPTISQGKLTTYARHWYWKVREAVAKNPRTPKRVLMLLSRSTGFFSGEITLSVVKNPNTDPRTVQDVISSQRDKEIIIAGLKRPDLSIRTYRQFSENLDPEIRDLASISLAISTMKPFSD